MKIPQFDGTGVDKVTFAPVELYNRVDDDGVEDENEEYRLLFHDWDWIQCKFRGDTVNEYYLNGYGIEGLAMACRLHAGLDPEADGIDYDAEGDACYIYFENLDDAVTTAKLVSEMLHDESKLRAMIQVARDNDFED